MCLVAARCASNKFHQRCLHASATRIITLTRAVPYCHSTKFVAAWPHLQIYSLLSEYLIM